MKIALFIKPSIVKGCLSLFVFIYIVSNPNPAYASFFSDLVTRVFGAEAQTSELVAPPTEQVIHNSQNVPLLESSINPDLKNIKDEPILNIIDSSDSIALSNDGALGTDSELEEYASSVKITTYVVKSGDTLEGISKKLKVPQSTIIASNADLKKSDLLKIGQNLVIIAQKDSSVVEKTDVKSIENDKKEVKTEVVKKEEVKPKVSETKVAVKEVPVVKKEEPKEEIAPVVPVTTPPIPPVQNVVAETPPVVPSQNIAPVQTEQPQLETSTPTGQPTGTINGGYIWPFPAGTGRVSQGRHADNAYDFAAPKGTPIFAVQSGKVLIARPTGYNGGFGLYAVIDFDDGRQAIFGHMSKVVAEAGQVVKQGDIIGYVGSTGKSTGPHLHLGFHGELSNPYLGLKINAKDLQKND